MNAVKELLHFSLFPLEGRSYTHMQRGKIILGVVKTPISKVCYTMACKTIQLKKN